MEKLQMASHAIGDIEALLEASGISGEDENGATGFDERIRQLVIAALAGKDMEEATRQAEQSIADAKSTLEPNKRALMPCSAAWMGPSTSDLTRRPCRASCDRWSRSHSRWRP
jgi:hypothetical protein